MKKFALLAAVLAVVMLFGISAMAAPLENPNLETTQVDLFAAWTDGMLVDATTNSGLCWVFSGGNGSAPVYQNGYIVLDENSANPDVPYTARLNLNDAKMDPGTIDGITGVAFYVENNSEMEAGVGFMGERIDGIVGGGHQLTYSGADFYDVTCYLVDLDGNITRGKEYYDYNTYGQASVPAGFKGWFLIDLVNGGFNTCYYGSWGYDDPAAECDGSFQPGDGLCAVGFSICGDLGDNETIVLGDYALWTANGTMPAAGQVLKADGTLTDAEGGEQGGEQGGNDPIQGTADVSTIAFALAAVVGSGALIIRKKR